MTASKNGQIPNRHSHLPVPPEQRALLWRPRLRGRAPSLEKSIKSSKPTRWWSSNPPKNNGNQLKINGKSMENPWKINRKSTENQWKINGKSTENQWLPEPLLVNDYWGTIGWLYSSNGKSKIGKSMVDRWSLPGGGDEKSICPFLSVGKVTEDKMCGLVDIQWILHLFRVMKSIRNI